MTMQDDEIAETMKKGFQEFARSVVKKNKDKSIKGVGDKVLVWDSSRLTELGQFEVNVDPLDHAILAKYPSIVIEENCRFNADIDLGEGRYYPCNLDLIIYNKTLNKKFRTFSEFCKITKKNL